MSLSLSLSSSKSSYESAHELRHYSHTSLHDEYILPDRHPAAPIRQQPASSYPIDAKLCAPASPPEYLLGIGMQSTPIKSEDKASGVDYRNIESIVNSSTNTTTTTTTPLKEPTSTGGSDVVRNSVIKRAVSELPTDAQQPQQQQQPHQEASATTECCCRHKCCKHADSEGILEKTKILSDLILKSQNPLFRHLLASVDLQYGLQSMWAAGQQPPGAAEASLSTCAQDLRAKQSRAESSPTDMDQDLPLDLTINK